METDAREIKDEDCKIDSKTYEESKRRSAEIDKDLQVHPEKYKMLTGDRPTGDLHIGHLFGSLRNRIRLQNLGITSFILVADYQVFTDRDKVDNLQDNVRSLVLDYLAAGLDPDNGRTFIFSHSLVPELNQLLLPFLILTSTAELDRNPTVKEEIRAASLHSVPAIMYTYPIHQAADILSCRANIVPVGKDQLPHLEISRKIARRFNERFSPKKPVFYQPEALLSEVPMVLGLDGSQKMSKSRGNTIRLCDTEDATRAAIKKAKTDSERLITYDPENRPEVANLLRLASLCTGEDPKLIAERIGDGGSGTLKNYLTDVLNSYLAPIRAKRAELERDPEVVQRTLKRGVERAREEASATLDLVREAMGMKYY